MKVAERAIAISIKGGTIKEFLPSQLLLMEARVKHATDTHTMLSQVWGSLMGKKLYL